MVLQIYLKFAMLTEFINSQYATHNTQREQENANHNSKRDKNKLRTQQVIIYLNWKSLVPLKWHVSE